MTTTAQQINKAREHLRKAKSIVIDLASDAFVEAGPKSPESTGARYRMAKIASDQIDNIRSLLWEFPGVNWARYYKKCLPFKKHRGCLPAKKKREQKKR